MDIRMIQDKDLEAVKKLITDAFTQAEHGYSGEAELVEKIRKSKEYVQGLELVAADHDIHGYGLLSEVYLVNEKEQYTGLVLAPIAVNSGLQQKGIGKLLMNELEKRAKRFDYGFISILGHPEYYVKFGYEPASEYNIYPPFEGIPDEAFMIKEIQEGYLKNKEGTIQYSEAFN